MVLREEQSDEDIKSIISDVQDFGKLANSDKNTPLGGRFIGSIPLVVYNGWLQEYRLRGHEHFTLDQYVTLKFNSSEYSLLRDDYATMPELII